VATVGRRPGRRHLLPLTLGWVVIVVGLDWGAGIVLDAVRDEEPPSEGRVETPVGDAEVPPLMRDLPWAQDYVDEVAALPFEYQPFVIGALRPTDGPLITVEDGVRRTDPSPAPGADAVDVWFFGGSTMFGFGQRDQHTIPSVVARLAAEDGITVRAVNFGRPAFTAWQELLLFEDELARRPPPDLAVFYDGANDFFYQQAHPSPDPVHDSVDDLGAQLDDVETLPQPPGAHEESLWDRYTSASAVAEASRRVFGAAPVAAAESVDSPPADPVVAARDVYLRSIGLERRLAERADVEPFHFWQPVTGGQAEAYRALAASLPDPVVDLSGVLEDRSAEVFVDDVHTLETGARVVAGHLYEHLRPRLDALRP
jgi:hypothetical protein